jgi:gas vesicle protein
MMSFISGVTLGAFVGALAALMLAPESGGRVRARISQGLGTLRDEVRRAYAERMSQLEMELQSLRAPQQPGGKDL